MGVKDLWTILAPVKHEQPLESLKDRTLAIDLSVWICETHSVKQMQGVVAKPHLRNLFFRVHHLLQLNITPLFVLDGEAPELKWETMAKRIQARYSWRGRGRGAMMSTARKPGRSQLKSKIKECCSLLDYMGVGYVQAEGEAEAMCAFLNQKGLVDGVVTEDGDAFLYGATTVYRNFSINGKNPQVECYKMQDIESRLNIDREGLVAMGLLLGCDFCPKGVPGVGKEMALKLAKALKGENILARFRTWRFGDSFDHLDKLRELKKVTHCTTCKHPGTSKEHTSKGCNFCESDKYCEPQSYEYECKCEWHKAQKILSLQTVELAVRKKALEVDDFPSRKVIDEFTKSRNTMPRKSVKWKRPEKITLQKYAFEKMEWPEEYTEEKVLPLLTLWDMRNIRETGLFDASVHLKPSSIVKTRVRQGVPSYEVLWNKRGNDNTSESQFHVTIEAQDIFSTCFPSIVYDYESTAPLKKNQRKGSKKTSAKAKSSKLSQEMADQLLNLSLDGASDRKFSNPPRYEVDHWNSSGDVFEDLIEKEAEHQMVKSCPAASGIKNVKKKLGSQTVEERNGNLLADVALDVYPDHLEEADLLSLPLSQRLKLRSLMSLQLTQIKPSENNDLKQTTTSSHNFSSAESEDELPEKDTSVTMEVKNTEPEDVFWQEDDEIISGILTAQLSTATSTSDGRMTSANVYPNENNLPLFRQFDDFVTEMSNLSIDVDDIPTMNHCSKSAEHGSKTCTSENDVRTTNRGKFSIYESNGEETKLVENATGDTVCLQVGVNSAETDSRQRDDANCLLTTQCVGGADTVCIQISHENTKCGDDDKTLQHGSQDLTKTQLICNDTSYKSHEPTNCHITGTNVTRGYFDLQTNFTISLSEATYNNDVQRSAILKPQDTDATQVENLKLLDITEVIDLTCTPYFQRNSQSKADPRASHDPLGDTNLVILDDAAEDQAFPCGSKSTLLAGNRNNGNETTLLVGNGHHGDETASLVGNRNLAAETTLLVGNRNKDNETAFLFVNENPVNENISLVGMRNLGNDSTLLVGNRGKGSDVTLLLCNENRGHEKTLLVGGNEATLIVGSRNETTLLVGNRKECCEKTLIVDNRNENGEATMIVGNRNAGNEASLLVGNRDEATDTTTIIDIVNVDSFYEPAGAEVNEVVHDIEFQGNHCQTANIFLDVSSEEMDISLADNSEHQIQTKLLPSGSEEMNMSNDRDSGCPNQYLNHFVEESPMCDRSFGSVFSSVESEGSAQRSQSQSGIFRKFSNRTAGANFLIDSSLLSNLSDRSTFTSGDMSSDSVGVKTSASLKNTSESSASSNSHTSLTSSSELEPSRPSRSARLKVKKILRETDRNGKISKGKKKSRKQKPRRSAILAEAVSQKFNSSETNDESILGLVDDIIISQVPRKNTEIQKLISHPAQSKENDMSLLDLLDEVISSTQGPKKKLKAKKTGTSKRKKSKTTSLRSIDINTM